MTGPAAEDDASSFEMAPWALRRARRVQLGLVGGGLVLAAAIVAMLVGTPSLAIGLVLASVLALAGVGAAWWLRRVVAGVRLELDRQGVRYRSGRTRIEVAWDDVAAVDLVLRGTDTGPALVLKEDRAAAAGGRLAMGDVGGVLGGASVAVPSMRSTIPLAAFVEGRFVGSPLEHALRRHVPALVDGFVLRHPDRVR